MKYIIYKDGDKEYLVTFPKAIEHKKMAEAMEVMRFGGDHDWHRNQGKIVGAGFIEAGQCTGSSETLNIGSRLQDTAIYRNGGVGP